VASPASSGGHQVGQRELKALVEDKFVDSLRATAATMTIQERNDVEQDTEVQVRTKNLDATRQKLTLEKDREFALLSQKREIENTRAEHAALIATQQAERSREAEAANLARAEAVKAEEAVNTARQLTVAEREKNIQIKQVMNSALQHQIAKPIVDAVMKDAGLSNDGITGMAQALSGMEDAAAAVHPTVGTLDDPPPGFEPRLALEGLLFFATCTDVGGESELAHDVAYLAIVIALVQAQALGFALGGRRALGHDVLQRFTRELHVVPVRPVNGRCQREARAFGQYAALDALLAPVRRIAPGFC
jgi:uncharacterized membrane protein YqiK